MGYVLFVLLQGVTNTLPLTATSMEFNDLKSCDAAAKVIKADFPAGGTTKPHVIYTRCLEKGK